MPSFIEHLETEAAQQLAAGLQVSSDRSRAVLAGTGADVD